MGGLDEWLPPAQAGTETGLSIAQVFQTIIDTYVCAGQLDFRENILSGRIDFLHRQGAKSFLPGGFLDKYLR